MSRNKLPQSLVVACALALMGTAASAQPAPPQKAAAAASARLEPGVVAILRNGRAAALGLVLGGDGRIVTSRTGLGGNTKNIVVRYADGSTIATSVGHDDRASDLALLVPAKAAWTQGFVPSNQPLGPDATLTSFEVVAGPPGGKDVGRRSLRTGGPAGASAVDVDVTGPAHLGSPALDASGQAAGVVVASCDTAADPKCKPKTRLATVAAMRAFLRALPAGAAIPTTFLGVRGERAIGSFARGVRVVEVIPGSPAAQANLSAGPDGDLVLAIAGKPVTTPDELTSAIRAHAPGDKVAMTLFSRGAYRQVDVVLAKSAAGAPAPGAPTRPTPPPGTPSGAPRDFKSPG